SGESDRPTCHAPISTSSCPKDLLAEPVATLKPGFGKDNEKLLPAPPRNNILLANLLPKQLRAAKKDLVADGMPVFVVDAFEEVYVQHDYANWRSRPVAPRRLVF